MTIAITRDVSSRFNECEITHIDRTPIDLKIAQRQHKEYVKALSQLGCQLIELPEEPNLPDSVLVDARNFQTLDQFEVDASAPFAANCLPVNREIIFTTAFPVTRSKLEARGYKIHPVDVDELAKAEGAVTCCSLIIQG